MNPRLALVASTAALALLSFAAIAHAQTAPATTPPANAPATAETACVAIEVQNLRVGQGPLMLAAYADAASFRKAPVSSMQTAASAETLQLQVCGMPAGDIAFALFQDLNGNGKLDSNPLGMPTEPWGSSGRMSAFAAPTWETAKVAVDGRKVVIAMTK